MNYYIDEVKCKELGVTLPELFAILLVKSTDNISELFKQMTEKEILRKENLFGTYMVNQSWDDKVMLALLNADPKVPKNDRIDALAEKLMKVFPEGKQPGGKYYFRGNKKDISLKLKKFFKLYGNTYTDEQIINAAKRYVEAFNGNYTYMRLLKYFIWKQVCKIDSDGNHYIEEVSELADYITNEDSSNNSSDWAVNLV